MESGTETKTDFINENIYVSNDVFDAFYEDYLEYKGYVNDTLNTLIPKDNIFHRIEKENTTKHSKKVKSLENQIENLKRENQFLKEILTLKFCKNNENNIANNNIDNTWKTVKGNKDNNADNKDKRRIFNSVEVRNKYQLIFVHKTEVREPQINNTMNNDVNEYKECI